MPEKESGRHAVYGSRVVISPGNIVTNSWVLVKGNRIEKVVTVGEVPEGYRRWQNENAVIYPGFIESYLEVEVANESSDVPGAHWNERVQPQREAVDGKLPDSGTRGGLRKSGFGVAHVVPSNGLVRGSSGFISLGDVAGDRSVSRPPLLDGEGYQVLAFEGGRNPNSLMGQVALIRQVLLDAEYNSRSGAEIGPNVLDSLRIERSFSGVDGIEPTSFLFSVIDEVDLIRAERILHEFGISRGLLIANGHEFKRMKAMSGDFGLVVPLSFPKAPSIASVGEQESVDLRQLMDWEHVPSNLRLLTESDLNIVLTSSRGEGDFLKNLKKALKAGADPDKALAALTVNPSRTFGLENEVGSLRPGRRANLVVADNDLFDAETESRILYTWVDGKAYEISDKPDNDIKGSWEVTGDFPFEESVRLEIKNNKSASLIIGDVRAEVSHYSSDGDTIHFVSRHSAFGVEPLVIFSGGLEDPDMGSKSRMRGRMTNLDGSGIDWTAVFTEKRSSKPESGQKDAAGDPDLVAWTGFWEGRLQQNGRKEDFSMTVLQDTKGRLYGHIKGEDDIYPLNDIKSSGDEFKATVFSNRKLVHVYIRPIEDGGVRGWAQENGAAVQMNINGKRLSSTDSGKAMEGRWQLQAISDTEDAKKEAIISLKYDEGQWRGTVSVDGETIDIIHGWSNGLGKDEEGVHLIFPSELDADTSGGGGLLKIQHDTEQRLFSGMLETDGREIPLEIAKVLDGKNQVASTEDKEKEKKETQNKTEEPYISPLALPYGPYSSLELPVEESVWVRGVTLWTSGPAGTIRKGHLLTHGGKVVYAGAAEGAEAAAEAISGATWRIINGDGHHVTPGLIDCHSHTGISRGINEVGQAVTAEADIGNSTDPDDINWYRQLAGGLTTVNTLHGSANPIGGQNQVNKLRWGVEDPYDMHFEGSIPGIKFALGENVKRSQSRYPNTRMGVETIFRERFTAAREYLAQWDAYRNGQISAAPRRDLELDALGEILEGRRLIHCHSYRQDEILMLCQVAADYGFTIGTFQHILEGYKVAEAIREHALGGSAFSDWWAYKVEVQDAIPYAGAIMHKAGVLVSFNSDDTEMARRMNLEAAKAVKYGNLSEEEALKFVTLNPARQLKIDDRVGSLEVGKDADFVIWSGHPFSTASVCQSTWVDGREYFSIEKDREHRKLIASERKRLISKIAGEAGKETSVAEDAKAGDKAVENKSTANDDFVSPFSYWENRVLANRNLQLMQWGIRPSESVCGECGIRGHQLIEK